MFDEKGRFLISDYTKKSTFSSFLPGISGKFGIPIWCFYVNRGQGVTSFGVEDKEHSIMEFYPAHQSYQLTKTHGFRTFLKIDGEYYEPFLDGEIKKNMFIGMNEFEVEERNESLGIQTNVLYFTLPEENLGGLVRKVTITNIGAYKKQVELLDGMPAILPYGVPISSMKEMGQTTKAWMQVEDLETLLPFFRVRVSMEDSADVKQVTGGHFYISIDEEGKKLPVVVDPELIFQYDTALIEAVGFIEKPLEDLLTKKQVTQNNVPCAFWGKETILEAKHSIIIYSVIGQVEKKELLTEFAMRCNTPAYFEEKYKIAYSLTNELCKAINTKTGDPIFDAYCKQTYLDNLLRGGYPVLLGKDKIFYLYSRKHGDIERDYNFFCMLPEYYSQGNANFRDVNQNRRCDVLFHPYVGDYNIKTFYNLIQTDGYNPLSVKNTSYKVKSDKMKELLLLVNEEDCEAFEHYLKESFTPGSLLKYIGNNKVRVKVSLQELLDIAVAVSDENVNADFGEGYWCDHWTYNLDLIESYLMVYPDREMELLFQDSSYTYFEAKATILPRTKRYVLTDNGVRQYHAVDRKSKAFVEHKQVKTGYGMLEIFTSNLMTKLILLNVVKFATLDPYGMGIEMEGGKPGWYDALNGLPGIFGSSMCETYELCRNLEFTIEKLKKYLETVKLPKELVNFMTKINEVLAISISGETEQEKCFRIWDCVNQAKEDYREITKFGLDGITVRVSAEELIEILQLYLDYVKCGIDKAINYGDGISPAYFTYEVSKFDYEKDVVTVKSFQVHKVPNFLEGAVRYLKLENTYDKKYSIYDRIKSSGLYDKKLNMYKVNESLNDASYEIGRAKAFTPGWLENESIWLHMEYKYLLELLKCGFYEEFYEDFKNQCIPFLNENMYGRSLLENSSFIVSSANPDEKIHGKGFVARLSGSTVEFIHMWQLMMFGARPFLSTIEGLTLKLTPSIPKYLIGKERKVSATFLGTTEVEYYLDKREALIPSKYKIESIKLFFRDKVMEDVKLDYLNDKQAKAVRAGFVEKIKVNIIISNFAV